MHYSITKKPLHNSNKSDVTLWSPVVLWLALKIAKIVWLEDESSREQLLQQSFCWYCNGGSVCVELIFSKGSTPVYIEI